MLAAKMRPSVARQYIIPWSAITTLGPSVVSCGKILFLQFGHDGFAREVGAVLPLDFVGHQVRRGRTERRQRADAPQGVVFVDRRFGAGRRTFADTFERHDRERAAWRLRRQAEELPALLRQARDHAAER